jgi:hypothetical protein
MAEQERPKEIIYVQVDGRFVPEHLLSRPKELKAYTDGYGTKGIVSQTYSGNTRLAHLFEYGSAISESAQSHLRTKDGVHYKSKPLRNPKPFPETGLRDEPNSLELTTAHVGLGNLSFIPNWAFPNYSEK